MTKISPAELAGLDGLGDWRYLLGELHGEFRLASFGAAASFVAEIGAAADATDHHPTVALRYPGIVRVAMHTHVAHAITELDVELARAISALAEERGATPAPLSGQAMEIAIDTMDEARIKPFWLAVLGYVETGGVLADPTGRGPSLWFQQMDEPRTERQRFHIDVTVPHDVAEARVAAAIAAGGRLVSDAFARSWWILADADGNEACVCTWQDRTSST